MMPDKSVVKILIVDYDLPTVEAVAYTLKKAGFVVLTTTDAASGLNLYRRENPALVILNDTLASGDGCEVCQVIRQEGETPIVFLSTRTTKEDRSAGMARGASTYVTKPFSMRDLLAQVRSLIGASDDTL